MASAKYTTELRFGALNLSDMHLPSRSPGSSSTTPLFEGIGTHYAHIYVGTPPQVLGGGACKRNPCCQNWPCRLTPSNICGTVARERHCRHGLAPHRLSLRRVQELWKAHGPLLRADEEQHQQGARLPRVHLGGKVLGVEVRLQPVVHRGEQLAGPLISLVLLLLLVSVVVVHGGRWW